MVSKRDKFGRLIGEIMEIPPDIVLDLPRITILGRSEIMIENHRGIIEYGLNTMKINFSRGFLSIVGEGLEIKSLNSEEIKVIGLLNHISYND